MGLAEFERKREEKIDGVIYDMSPRPHFLHGVINGNIYRMISAGLQGSMCLVFMENLDFHYHPDKNDDYVCPDIMIVCDRRHLKGSFYNGIPKFIVETLSPSTAKKDRTVKYVLEENYILQDDTEEEDYNAEQEICLRAFPHIKMMLREIFEGV